MQDVLLFSFISLFILLFTMEKENCLVFCIATCILVISSGFAIASLVIGVHDGDNPCQGDDRTSLTLQDWLYGYSIPSLVLVFTAILIVYRRLHKSEADIIDVVYSVFFVCYILFEFAWAIIGIVILCRSHSKCVSDGSDIGIITIIDLALFALGLCSSGVGCVGKISE
jgi:hypothetical protein